MATGEGMSGSVARLRANRATLAFSVHRTELRSDRFSILKTKNSESGKSSDSPDSLFL